MNAIFKESYGPGITNFVIGWIDSLRYSPEPEYSPGYIENRMRHVIRDLATLRREYRGRFVLSHKGKPARQGIRLKTGFHAGARYTHARDMQEFVDEARWWLKEVKERIYRQETDLDQRLYVILRDLFEGERDPFSSEQYEAGSYGEYYAYHQEYAKHLEEADRNSIPDNGAPT